MRCMMMEVKMSDSQIMRMKKQFLGPVEHGDAVQRFPCEGNVEHRVVLSTQNEGIYYNLAFHKGVPNEINGNMADKLLNDFPGVFRIVEVNGQPYKQTQEEDRLQAMAKKLEELENSVKVEKDTSEDRNTNRNAFTRNSKQDKDKGE